MNQRKEKGITLVALVITIIVMLMIAGVAISAITTGGLPFGKIKEGAEKYNQAALNEANDMNGVYGMLNQSDENVTPDAGLQVNKPQLAGNVLIPIKWDETKKEWVDTNENDSEWYHYEAQSNTTEQPGTGTSKWANARTADGSMFVWIPRYAYKITNGYHTANTGKIDIVFMKDATFTDYAGSSNYGDANIVPTYSGSTQTNYIVHPAFRMSGSTVTELSGIWVAKFKASKISEGTGGSEDGKVDVPDVSIPDDGGIVVPDVEVPSATVSQFEIKPNKIPWTVTNSTATFIRAYSNYGYGDVTLPFVSHVMQNSEWGAVAYLAHSKYGRNGTEVSINNASGSNGATAYTTGYSGGTNINAGEGNTTYSYETPQGQLASTTGNIYGIYDMSGGIWEYVCKNVGDIAYGADNFTYAENEYGRAMYETSNAEKSTGLTASWFQDASIIGVTSSANINLRGGNYQMGTNAGLFAFAEGTQTDEFGFRTVLRVQ